MESVDPDLGNALFRVVIVIFSRTDPIILTCGETHTHTETDTHQTQSHAYKYPLIHTQNCTNV